RNKVPQRGHGHPISAACGAGAPVAAAIAGAPHRGQKRPSKVAPQRTHCIRSHTRAPRYLMLRCAATKADCSCDPPAKIYIDSVGCAALRPAWRRLRRTGRNDGMEYEERSRQNADVRFETIRSEKVNFARNNFLEVARKRATTSEGTKKSSPRPEATIFRTRRNASSVLSRSRTMLKSARLSRTEFARSSPRGGLL